MTETAGPRMSIAWPVGLGTGERSTIVMEVGVGMRESQYARHGPAMPAPDMRILRGVVLESDILFAE
jgi:hypothetical protein